MDLPERYLAYMKSGNSTEGELSVDPGRFQLWPLDDLEKLNHEYAVSEFLPGFRAFGSSGGGEMFAFNSKDQIEIIPFIPMEANLAKLLAQDWPDFESKMIAEQKEKNMDVLAKNECKIYGAIAIDDTSGFVSPFPGSLFPCLIWDHNGRFTGEERSAVARALLEAGCRYVVCGGAGSEAWHDDVDEEFVSQHLNDPEDVLEELSIMTTYHDGESPDDVAFFFVRLTNFDDHDFKCYLVLHVGTGETMKQVDDAVRAYALDEKAARSSND